MEARKKVLIRLVTHNGGLVLADPERARWVAKIHGAIESSRTWADFRQSMPATEYSRLLTEAFDENDEERPAGDDPFDPESLPGWSDGDYPPWLQAEMDQLLPREILAKYGVRTTTHVNGSYWHIPEVKRVQIAQELTALGWEVFSADDLQFW